MFKGPLAAHFESIGDKPSDTAMLLPFIVFLAVFAVVMPLEGRPMEKYGPRLVAAAGGVLVGLGWMLASFATDPTILAVLYGVVGGAGVGLAYGSSPCRRAGFPIGGAWPWASRCSASASRPCSPGPWPTT